MDEILNDEERSQKQLSVELKLLRDQKFKKAEEVHEARRNEKSVQALMDVRVLPFIP